MPIATRLLARCALVLGVPLLLVACQSNRDEAVAQPTMPPLNQTITLLDGAFQIKIPAAWRVDAQLSDVGFIDIYSTPFEADADLRRGQVIALTVGLESEASDGDTIAAAVRDEVALELDAPNAPQIVTFSRDGQDAARLSTPAVDPDSGTRYFLDVLGYEIEGLHIVMVAFDFEGERAALFEDIFASIRVEPAALRTALFPMPQ